MLDLDLAFDSLLSANLVVVAESLGSIAAWFGTAEALSSLEEKKKEKDEASAGQLGSSMKVVQRR